jgi:hypothetical protein
LREMGTLIMRSRIYSWRALLLLAITIMGLDRVDKRHHRSRDRAWPNYARMVRGSSECQAE